MPSYHTFTSTRLTEPDRVSLLTLLRAADPTVGLKHQPGSGVFVLKRNADADWTAPEIAAAQTVIETAPAESASLSAQRVIQGWPIEQRAFAYAVLDQINTLRAALPTPLAAITPAQMLAGIVNKAKALIT